MRGGEVKEGSPNKERGGCIGAGSFQSQPGANLHPNTANKRVRAAKGGEADGVALTVYLKEGGNDYGSVNLQNFQPIFTNQQLSESLQATYCLHPFSRQAL
jgi:hypothetical protein